MGTVEQKRPTPQGNRASAKYGATTRFDLLCITWPQTVLSRCIWKTRWAQAARGLRKDGHEGTARGCKKHHCKNTGKQCLRRNLPTPRAAAVAVHARRQLQGCSRISCEVPSGVRRVLPRCRVLAVANAISLAKWIKPREASSAAGLALVGWVGLVGRLRGWVGMCGGGRCLACFRRGMPRLGRRRLVETPPHDWA